VFQARNREFFVSFFFLSFFPGYLVLDYYFGVRNINLQFLFLLISAVSLFLATITLILFSSVRTGEDT